MPALNSRANVRYYSPLSAICPQLRANTKSVHMLLPVSVLFRQKMSQSARIANQKLDSEPDVVS